MKITWVLPDVGNYHLARMRAVAEHPGIRAAFVEAFGKSEYDEFRAVGRDDSVPIETLFPSKRRESVSRRQLSQRIRAACATLDPDVICLPGWGTSLAAETALTAMTLQTPAVVFSDTTRMDRKRQSWKEGIKRHSVSVSSAALVGGTLHRQYMRELGMPDERIFVGYDVVDNGHFESGADHARAVSHTLRRELGLPGKYFLASCRFVPKKNLTRLITAYARYRERSSDGPWNLVVLGDGEMRPELEAQIRQDGLSGSIHMPGFKCYELLPDYFGLANAFVHASTTEQWGLVVNEAMAAGLPVIVSDRCGCAPDLVKHGENGFSFDPYDEDALAECMLRMAADGCDRAAMGEASRRIIARWTPQTFAESLLKAAEVAVAAPRRQACALDRGLLWALARR